MKPSRKTERLWLLIISDREARLDSYFIQYEKKQIKTTGYKLRIIVTIVNN